MPLAAGRSENRMHCAAYGGGVTVESIVDAMRVLQSYVRHRSKQILCPLSWAYIYGGLGSVEGRQSKHSIDVIIAKRNRFFCLLLKPPGQPPAAILKPHTAALPRHTMKNWSSFNYPLSVMIYFRSSCVSFAVALKQEFSLVPYVDTMFHLPPRH